MSTPTISEEDLNAPDPDDYKPSGDTSSAVAQLKDLALWMRKHGFTARDIQVSGGVVILTGFADPYVRKPKEQRAADSDSAGLPEYYAEVADPEHIAALRESRREG